MSAPKDLVDTIAGLEKAQETLGDKPKHPRWHSLFTKTIAQMQVNGVNVKFTYCSRCKTTWQED